jgi:hypothetical protein
MTLRDRSDTDAEIARNLRRAKWLLIVAGVSLTASITLMVIRVVTE